MIQFSITKVESADWDELVEGEFSAFAEEPFSGLIRGKNTAANRDICKKRHIEDVTKQSNTLWLKAVEAKTNRTVGVANYKFSMTYVPLQKKEYGADMDWLDNTADKRILVAIASDVQDRKLRHVKEGHISKCFDINHNGDG